MKSNSLSWHDPATPKILKKALEQDKLVLTSTDTVFGLLGCLNPSVYKQLNAAKKRTDKPYLILVGSAAKAQRFIDPLALSLSKGTEHVQNLMATAWPGPLTLILPAKAGGTVALRVPNHPGLLALLKHFDGLFSTSANIAGAPVPTYLNDVDPRIFAAVAHVVDGEQQEAPSTILDCTGERIKVVREGAYPLDQLNLYI